MKGGKGVPYNIELARKYYIKATENDTTGTAYNYLGGTYMDESGENDRIAVSYFQKAVELGNPNAMFRLWIYMSEGRGGLQSDIQKEVDLLKQAAEKKNIRQLII